MSDPTYDAWRDVRRRCLENLAEMPSATLRLLATELRQLADTTLSELARREKEAERQDERLYRQKERPR